MAINSCATSSGSISSLRTGISRESSHSTIAFGNLHTALAAVAVSQIK